MKGWLYKAIFLSFFLFEASIQFNYYKTCQCFPWKLMKWGLLEWVPNNYQQIIIIVVVVNKDFRKLIIPFSIIDSIKFR